MTEPGHPRRGGGEWAFIAAMALFLFVSATNFTDPSGTGWDVARATAALTMLVLLAMWLVRRRRQAGNDWERQRYL